MRNGSGSAAVVLLIAGWAAVVWFAALSAPRAEAIDTVNGTISGNVLDANGNGVIRATIQFTRPGHGKHAGSESSASPGTSPAGPPKPHGRRHHHYGIKTMSNIGGAFSVTLSPGTYSITATAGGATGHAEITVSAGEKANVTVTLGHSGRGKKSA